MLADVVGVLGGTALAGAGIVAVYRAPGRLQMQVRNDSEILANLPLGSEGHKLLLGHIERRLEVLTLQARKRRNPRGVLQGSAILFFALLLLIFSLGTSGWVSALYLAEAGGMALLSVATIAEATVLTDRDYRGQRVKQALP